MQKGDLVSDPLMIRLILNELTTRGWLQSSQRPLIMNSVGADHIPTAADAEAFVNPTIPRHSLSTSDAPAASFLLDGFPRNVEQARLIEENNIPINLCVHIDTPMTSVLQRIQERWIHAPSGRVYNESFNPPKVAGKDDVTGEALSKRADDNEEVFRSRWQRFESLAQPLCDFYATKGVLVRVRGETSDEITPLLVEEVQRKFG
jgi:adenylate kinase